MTKHVTFDRSALDLLTDVDRYKAATHAIEQARQAVADTAAYRDSVVAAMVDARPYRGGPAEVARILDIPTATVSTHTRKHRERTMPQIITRAEDPTRLPALSHMYTDGQLHVDAITSAGVVAQIAYPTDDQAEALEQVAEEITPWLAVLDALAREDQARAAHRDISHALAEWESSRTYPSEEQYMWAELGRVVDQYKTHDDHTPEEILLRLASEADDAHQCALASAPGAVPELLLWTTPTALSGPATPLAQWLKSRLT